MLSLVIISTTDIFLAVKFGNKIYKIVVNRDITKTHKKNPLMTKKSDKNKTHDEKLKNLANRFNQCLNGGKSKQINKLKTDELKIIFQKLKKNFLINMVDNQNFNNELSLLNESVKSHALYQKYVTIVDNCKQELKTLQENSENSQKLPGSWFIFFII